MNAEYSYNVAGLRKSKTVNGNTTRFVYNGADVVGELTNDNYYVYYRATELIGYKAYTGESYYFRRNAHGDVTAILDVFGNEVKNYNYDAFGEKKAFVTPPAGENTILYQWKAETENVHNPFGYCGEYTDNETGLVYLRNRMYSPNMSRFITEDPVKDGLNWYAYCENNPIMFFDPWGLKDVPLREFVEEHGGTVEWDAYSNAAIVSFGSAGKKIYWAGIQKTRKDDSASSERPYLKWDYVNGEVTKRLYVNDKDIINDFGIKDSINRYSEQYSAYITFTLFEKDNRIYQRFVVNCKEIEYKKVKYSSFDFYTPSWVKSRYSISIGSVNDSTRYWANDEWKNSIGDILSSAGETASGSGYSWADFASLSGNILGMKDWSNSKILPGDVDIYFGQNHYFLEPKSWILREV